MNYSREVENMCTVAKGLITVPLPFPKRQMG